MAGALAPVTIEFDGSGSSDPDCQYDSACLGDPDQGVMTWAWNFGDGGVGSGSIVSHTYSSAGSFTATLTVTDAQGGQGTTDVPISVAAPPQIDHQVAAQEVGSGSVTGSISDLDEAGDGRFLVVTEVETGGNAKRRRNQLQHTLVFNVQGGDEVTLIGSGYQSNSNDNDMMSFSYSVDGSGYQSLPISLGSTLTEFSAVLPGSGGQVRIQIQDTDRTRGAVGLDSVTLDQLIIRTVNGGSGGGGTGDGTGGGGEVTTITLEASGSKQKGVKTVDLSWDGLSGGNLYRNGLFAGSMTGNNHTEALGKGGGTYTYQLCTGDLNSDCSNTATVVF